MRLLLILTLISLTACSGVVTTADNLQPVVSSPSAMINFTKSYYYAVPKVAQKEHQQCADFAIRELQIGETCRWDKGKAVGFVKLVKIDSNQCHYMYNTIYYKNKPKYWQTKACYSNSSGKWRYIK